MNTFVVIVNLISYFTGWSLHITKRATVAKSKRSVRDRITAFIAANQINLGIRLFIVTTAVLVWMVYPDVVTRMMRAFAGGIPETGTITKGLKAVLMAVSITPNLLTLGVIGYVADSLLDWAGAKWKMVGDELPPLKDVPATVVMDSTQVSALINQTKEGGQDVGS